MIVQCNSSERLTLKKNFLKNTRIFRSSLEAQILASRPKILVSRLKSEPRGSNPSLEARILVL